jgi:flagellar motor switch/type III secretory pathway protein FliN
VKVDATPAAPRGVRLEFGRQWLPSGPAGRLGADAVVELDAPAEGAVDVYADGRLRARGEPVVVDGKLCVRVREVIDAGRPAALREGP